MAERRELEIVVKAKDLVSRTLGPLRASMKRFGAVSEVALKAARTAGRAAVGAFKAVGRAVKTALGPLTLISGVLAGISGYAIFRGLDQTANALDLIAKRSTRLGVSVEFLQQMDFAAQRAGLSTEELLNSIQFGIKNTQQALVQGTGEAVRVIERLPIELQDALRAGDFENAFPQLVQEINQLEDPLTSFLQVFGRSGAGIKQLAAEDLPALVARFNELGGALSQEQVNQAVAYVDAMTDFKTVLELIKREVAVAVFPALTTALKDLVNFIVDNRESLVAGLKQITGVAVNIITSIASAFAGNSDAIKALSALVNAVFEELFSAAGTAAGNAFKRGFAEIVRDIYAFAGAPGLFNRGPGDAGGEGGFDLERITRLYNNLVEVQSGAKQAASALSEVREEVYTLGEVADVVAARPGPLDFFGFGIAEAVEAGRDQFSELVSLGKQTAEGIRSAFANNFFAATQREFTTFSQFVKSIFADLANSILRIISNLLAQQVLQSFASFLGIDLLPAGISGGTAASGAGAAAASGGGAAVGGVSGFAAASGGSTTIINIRAVDTRSFSEAIKRNPDAITSAVIDGVAVNNNARSNLLSALQ